MNLVTLLQTLHESLETSSPEEIFAACKLIAQAQEMKAVERDVVTCAFNHGPLHDGDVPSKAGRDSLLFGGFITKVVVRGEDGFNALTHKGHGLYKILNALQAAR